MIRDTRIALFLNGELVAALCANDPDVCRGGVRGHLGALSDRVGGTAAGLALLVPDCRRAGNAEGLAPWLELLVQRG